jgi:ABC-type proline/glycine betaine transport system permease subunit
MVLIGAVIFIVLAIKVAQRIKTADDWNDKHWS